MEGKLDDGVSFQELLAQNNYDSAILKAIMRMKLLNPTIIQSELLGLLHNKRKIVVNYSTQSGKSTGAAILLTQLFMEHLKNTEAERQQRWTADPTAVAGDFGVFLCSSRDICEKTTQILENVSFFCRADHGVQIKNLGFYENTSQYSLKPKENYILVATPAQFLRFFKALKLDSLKHYAFLAFDDIDYQLSFGYEKDLLEISALFSSAIDGMAAVIFLSSLGLTQEVTELRKKFIPKAVILKCEELEGEEEEEEEEHPDANKVRLSQINQMYFIGDDLAKFMALYLGFKVNFFNGKTLIVCRNTQAQYRIQLFLKRIGVNQVQLYKSEDSRSLRMYTLTIFNSGLAKILVATSTFFEELLDKKLYKKKKKQGLQNVSNIVFFDFRDCFPYYKEALKYLGHNMPGLLFSLISKNTAYTEGRVAKDEEEEEKLKQKDLKKNKRFAKIFDDEINLLSRLIEEEKKGESLKVNLREFPVRKLEMEAFRYRVSDVFRSVTLKQIKLARMVDFKKQLLKSKNMVEYFTEHPEEKEIILDSVKKMQATLNRYAVRLTDDVPDYLLPEFIKEHRKRQTVQEADKPVKKVLSQKWNEDYEKSLEKRAAANNLTLEDVHKKRKMDSDKYITVDERYEDPEVTNPEYLKPVSGRKLWKMKHKFSLKRKNKRLEKKGVFQT